jgi:hypothetical protein
MGQSDEEDVQIEEASQEVARAIWQTVLLSRDEYKARGLLGKATRKKFVDGIVKLAKIARKKDSVRYPADIGFVCADLCGDRATLAEGRFRHIRRALKPDVDSQGLDATICRTNQPVLSQ